MVTSAALASLVAAAALAAWQTAGYVAVARAVQASCQAPASLIVVASVLTFALGAVAALPAGSDHSVGLALWAAAGAAIAFALVRRHPPLRLILADPDAARAMGLGQGIAAAIVGGLGVASVVSAAWLGAGLARGDAALLWAPLICALALAPRPALVAAAAAAAIEVLVTEMWTELPAGLAGLVLAGLAALALPPTRSAGA